MKIPFERFGLFFTRYSFNEAFHLISISGGLELSVKVYRNDCDILETVNHSMSVNELISFINQRVGSVLFDIVHANVKCVNIKSIKQILKYNVVFSMMNPTINYVEDIKPRSMWFRALHEHMKSNKCKYNFDSITDNVICVSHRRFSFICSFYSSVAFKNFIYNEINFIDSKSSSFYTYSISKPFKNKLALTESAVFLLKSSPLECVIKISEIPYKITITYERLSVVDNFINDLVEYIKQLGNIQYTHNYKQKIVVVDNVNCLICEVKPNYLMTHRNLIDSSFVNILMGMIDKYEIKYINDVD